MEGTLDDRYFEWLYEQIGSVRNRNPARSHWKLAKALYTKEFVWFVSNDDNRVEDGKELRYEFINAMGFGEVDPDWMNLGCSVLEMLIALSRRASYETENRTPGDWFWHLMKNLGVAKYTDDKYTSRVDREVDDILETLVYRTYSPSGEGGLFPLQSTRNDQRKVELWYQLAEYVLEEFPP